MRIVIDTNVVASAIFFGGRPKDLIELLVSSKLEAFASSEIILEYKETIEELCSKYPNKPFRLPLAAIISSINLIVPTSIINVCRDPDDNKFIECAVDADCLFIVSGDKDLLALEQYDKVHIVTVSDFIKQYY